MGGDQGKPIEIQWVETHLYHGGSRESEALESEVYQLHHLVFLVIVEVEYRDLNELQLHRNLIHRW